MIPGTVTPKPRVARSAIVAAIVLTLGVMGLFLRLQEYGPESAIRKFHQAISKGSLPGRQGVSWTDLQKVTVQDVRQPEVAYLVGKIADLMAAGGNRPRILRADRTPTEVRAVVAYTIPTRPQPVYMVWVVRRMGRTWRVDADGTLRVLNESF